MLSKFRDQSKLFQSGIFVVFIMLLVGLFAPFIAPMDPYEMHISDALNSPNMKYLLGTDKYGRDILSRIIFGTRLSLVVSSSVLFLTTIGGVTIAVIAGLYHSLENLLMRFMDALMAVPYILLGLALVSVFGRPSKWNVVLALSVVYLPRTVRVVYSRVIDVRDKTYVEAARALGSSDLRLMIYHIIPNCVATIIVQQTVVYASAILGEAVLSFLGAGAPPPTPSWGNILSQGKDLLQSASYIAVFPGLAIFIYVLGVNLAGDGLRDMLDPKTQTGPR